MDSTDTVARADAQDWRDEQRWKVTDALGSRLPGLLRMTDDRIEGMSGWALLRPGHFQKVEIAPIVADWMTRQYREIHASLGLTPGEDAEFAKEWAAENKWLWDNAAIGAGAALSVGPIALAALAVSLATVVTQRFWLFTTTSVNLPLLVAMIAGILAVCAFGYRWFLSSLAKKRARLRNSVRTAVEAMVVGETGDPMRRSLLERILGEIDDVARARMGLE